jgi:transcriptional regulator with XRE-family HTH domain
MRCLLKSVRHMAKSTAHGQIPSCSITTLPNRIRTLRTQAGLTQEDVAAAAGIDRANLVNIERSRRHNVRLNVLERIALALGVDVLDLLIERSAASRGPESASPVTRLQINLKRLRKERKISQEALSTGIGRFRTFIGNLENRTCKPTLEDIDAIAAFLGTYSAELFAPVDSLEASASPGTNEPRAQSPGHAGGPREKAGVRTRNRKAAQ